MLCARYCTESFICIVLFHPPYNKYYYVGVTVFVFQFYM